MTPPETPNQNEKHAEFAHPMSADEFRRRGYELIDWIAEYLESSDHYPVLSRMRPGELRSALPDALPDEGEPWEAIRRDFETHVMPGVTHWQSPNFFAYFPANVSYPSILGELLSAGLGVNSMLWTTSPAATELETYVLDLLVDAMRLPAHFKGGGVIQDTASNSSLCAILCGREQALQWAGNERGLSEYPPVTVYASDQAHSSIEKGAKIAGLGREHVRVIPSDDRFAMDPDRLEQAILQDRETGLRPATVCATLGTTSSLAIDPIRRIGEVCRAHDIWLHVDAAMAGSALICPEFQHLADGLELADSYCFNPHKWLLTNFDCDAFYVRDPQRLIRTLAIMPEYLKASQADEVINYRDWHVQLGRRFRALKLWFVLRAYGRDGLCRFIREHVRLAELFESWVEEDDRFEIATPRSLNLVCFRLRASDAQNEELLRRINDAGRIHLTHTKLNDRFTLRMCIAQTNTREEHVRAAWREIREQAEKAPAERDGTQ